MPRIYIITRGTTPWGDVLGGALAEDGTPHGNRPVMRVWREERRRGFRCERVYVKQWGAA